MRHVWNKLFDLSGFRGKTLWDWMSLLIVPLFIAGATLVFSIFELRREDQRAQAQQKIETDRAQQSVLQSYIQDMTTLLLDKELAMSEPDDPIRGIARSSTLAAVRQLDGERKGILLEFLSESKLLDPLSEERRTSDDPIIRMSGAHLTGAILSGANLAFADLRGANLSHADLSGAYLRGAYLSKVAIASRSLYRITDLEGANLSVADLKGADLRDADLSRANLFRADLTDVYLMGADLSFADLTDANLYNTILIGATLRGAIGWTNQQLAQAQFLDGATMPDGTVMTEEGWEEFKKRYR